MNETIENAAHRRYRAEKMREKVLTNCLDCKTAGKRSLAKLFGLSNAQDVGLLGIKNCPLHRWCRGLAEAPQRQCRMTLPGAASEAASMRVEDANQLER